jgi:hypothetical protein
LTSVLITATIDVFERRDVAIVDVPGAFLTADMDEEVIMCPRARLSGLMVKTAPNIYRKFISIDNTCNYVKLSQPQLRTRTYTQSGQGILRATQVRAALSHAYAVTYQNRITDKP